MIFIVKKGINKMKANSTHISLETAKLLKDCGIESKLSFASTERLVLRVIFTEDVPLGFCEYPAFTWQEILWEHADQLLGIEWKWKTKYLLSYLQEKDYDVADLEFRNHCILINNENKSN